ncbi:hypothetical protein V2S85_14480 [Novosphingobium resinovorum]|nr:hypothetical protein [Novosphingobium resinovorum]
MTMNLVERVEAVNATIGQFAGKPFIIGTSDCGKMVIAHLKTMGWTISTGGTWSTTMGLKRFLRRHGGSGATCIDGWGVPRIAPAAAIAGDIVELPDETGLGAFGIVVGNGRVLAFHEHADGVAIIQPGVAPLAAWRT